MSVNHELPLLAWIIAGSFAGMCFQFINSIRKQIAELKTDLSQTQEAPADGYAQELTADLAEPSSVSGVELTGQSFSKPSFSKPSFSDQFHKFAEQTSHLDNSEQKTTQSETAQEQPTEQLNNPFATQGPTVEYLVKRSQHALLVLDKNCLITHINQTFLDLIESKTSIDEALYQSVDKLIESKESHLRTLLAQALQSGKKVRFVQDGPQTADWVLTPLNEPFFKGTLIEVITPSKNEYLELEEKVKQLLAKQRITEKEMALYVNQLAGMGLYYQREGKLNTKLDTIEIKHPILRKGLSAINHLAEIISNTQHEIAELQSCMRAQQTTPTVGTSQINVVAQALMRNLQDLKRDYALLTSHHEDHQAIVNEQKGLTQNIMTELDKGTNLSKSCRDKTLAGFETITLILQNLHELENHFSLMAATLNETSQNLQKNQDNEKLARTLGSYLTVIREQIAFASKIADKNKRRLNILIPSYAGHHYQIGHLLTQWQSCHDLVESQTLSHAQWRQYNKNVDDAEESLQERIHELTQLSEKLLQKTKSTQDATQTFHGSLGQFEETAFERKSFLIDSQYKG